MNRDKKIDYYRNLILDFADKQISSGIDYEKKLCKTQKKVSSWIKKQCPSIKDFEIEDQLNKLISEEFDFVLSVLADIKSL